MHHMDPSFSFLLPHPPGSSLRTLPGLFRPTTMDSSEFKCPVFLPVSLVCVSLFLPLFLCTSIVTYFDFDLDDAVRVPKQTSMLGSPPSCILVTVPSHVQQQVLFKTHDTRQNDLCMLIIVCMDPLY